MRNAVRIVHEFLQRDARLGTPEAQRGDLLGLVDELHLRQARACQPSVCIHT